MSFVKKSILPDFEVIAQIFKIAREEENVTLEEVSADLKIDIKYLKALEEGRVDKLPKGVYEKNFLKVYANYLKIDASEILQVYDENIKHEKIDREKGMFVRKVSGDQYFLLIPRILKNLLIFLLVVACVIYLGFYLRNIIVAPELEIYTPQDSISIDSYKVEVYGRTENDVEVEINNKKVLIDESGNFVKEINLRTGMNNIKITAKKRYSKVNTVIRRILVK